jgi:hypothetical protein
MMMRDDQKSTTEEIELTTINGAQEEEQPSTAKALAINDEQQCTLLEVREQQEHRQSK